jgi:processive 1,2-diacylglycerol beta-glucosyltransferase
MTHPRTVLLSFALGTGHRQVAENLARELEPLGHVCEPKPLEDWVPWEYDLLFRRGYLFLILHLPRAWDVMYHSARFAGRGRLVLPVMNGRVLRAFEREGMGAADLVVATQYNAMEIAADWKRRHRANFRLATVITDYDIHPLWGRSEVDLYLVPHSDQAARLCELGVVADRVVVTGIPIARSFESKIGRDATRAALALAPEAPTAMLFGGGGGMGPLKEFAQVALERTSWQVVLVCGQNERLRRSLIPLAQAHPGRLRVLGYRKDISALMQACDVVVTKAGALSLTEALYSGTRVVIMPGLPGQEQANVRFMEAKGWADSCPRSEDLPACLEKGAGGGAPPRDALPCEPARRAGKCLDELAHKGT